MREVWVEAKGYPLYRVSSLGRIVEVATGREPQYFLKDGRAQYNLKGPNGWGIVQQNRLVAASFIEDDISGYDINHADGDRTNNTIINLELMTHDENREHAYQHGLMPRPVRIVNLTTGEVYPSRQAAGRALGLIGALAIPKQRGVFERKGYRLQVVEEI